MTGGAIWRRLLPGNFAIREHWSEAHSPFPQMEEEGVPSTALREVSLLLMLSKSRHIVR